MDLEVFNRLKQLIGERLSSIIEEQIKNTYENVNHAAEAIQHGDIEALKKAAHSLKGSSAQSGATRLNILAQKMERLAKRRDLDNAKILLVELRAVQEQVAQAMLQQIDDASEAVPGSVNANSK